MKRAALIAFALIGCAAALAQTPPRTRQLEELRREWDEKFKAHAQVNAASDAIAARVVQRQQAHTAKQAELAAIEQRLAAAWAPWTKILEQQNQKRSRQELREISDQLARDNLNLDQLRQRQKALSNELIVLARPFVQRLLEKADQARAVGRLEQAQKLEAEALEVLRFSEDLEAAQGPPDPVPQFPDLAGEVAGRSAAQLEQLAESYATNLRECEALLKELLPDEKEMEQRLRRLDRLVQDKAGGPNAPQLRDRTRKALERVVELRQAFEARASRYRERVQALQSAVEEATRREAEEQQRRSPGRDGPGGGG